MAGEGEQFNVVLLGDVEVGKTALVHQFTHGEVLEHYTHTFNDHYRKSHTVGSEVVDVNIYDTEDPYRLVPIAHAVIAVFSTASRESFDRLQPFSTFFAEFQENGGFICFVGTHADIDTPKVSRKEAYKMARDIRTKLFLVNVKNSEDAREPWDHLLHRYVQPAGERFIRTIETPAPPPTETEIASMRKEWSHWLASMGRCLGLRKARSGIWYR